MAFRLLRYQVQIWAALGRLGSRLQSGARVTQLGAAGRLETIGQPLSLSLSLQPGWLGW